MILVTIYHTRANKTVRLPMGIPHSVSPVVIIIMIPTQNNNEESNECNFKVLPVCWMVIVISFLLYMSTKHCRISCDRQCEFLHILPRNRNGAGMRDTGRFLGLLTPPHGRAGVRVVCDASGRVRIDQARCLRATRRRSRAAAP